MIYDQDFVLTARHSIPKLIQESTLQLLLLWVSYDTSDFRGIMTNIRLGPYPDILPFSEGEPMPKPGGVMMPKVLDYKLDFPLLSKR